MDDDDDNGKLVLARHRLLNPQYGNITPEHVEKLAGMSAGVTHNQLPARRTAVPHRNSGVSLGPDRSSSSSTSDHARSSTPVRLVNANMIPM
jgi:hypothetical protein